jgi:site-specific recombinase XerD
LRFAENELGVCPERLTLAAINVPFVERFLDWLETSGGCSISTRNLRLAAIRSFFRYLQREKPEFSAQYQQVLSLDSKSASKPLVNYLYVDAVKRILAVPDISDPYGLRDAAVLSLLYESGARVSEITSLNVVDVRVLAPAVVTVMGKGQKDRQCPLSAAMAENLSLYLSVWMLDDAEKSSRPIFVN